MPSTKRQEKALEALKQLCDALENPASYRREHALPLVSRLRDELPEIYKAFARELRS